MAASIALAILAGSSATGATTDEPQVADPQGDVSPFIAVGVPAEQQTGAGPASTVDIESITFLPLIEGSAVAGFTVRLRMWQDTLDATPSTAYAVRWTVPGTCAGTASTSVSGAVEFAGRSGARARHDCGSRVVIRPEPTGVEVGCACPAVELAAFRRDGRTFEWDLRYADLNATLTTAAYGEGAVLSDLDGVAITGYHDLVLGGGYQDLTSTGRYAT